MVSGIKATVTKQTKWFQSCVMLEILLVIDTHCSNYVFWIAHRSENVKCSFSRCHDSLVQCPRL